MSRYSPSEPERYSLEAQRQSLRELQMELRKRLGGAQRRVSEIARSLEPPKTIEEAVAHVGRRRDRDWLTLIIKNIVKGLTVEEAAQEATAACYPALRNRSTIANKALAKMHQPDLCRALEDIYAVSGFTIEDAVKTHIKHIKGQHKKDVLTATGEVRQVRIPPSFQALAAYQKMVMPSQTQKVQIEHTNVNEMLRTIDGEVGPATHRIVGEVIDVDPGEDPDDADPFEEESEDDDRDDPEGD